MAIDVTVFINSVAKNNPNVSANIKKGVSSATAFFSAAQSGGVNPSTMLDTSKLSPSDQANLAKFNQVAGTLGSLQNGGSLNVGSVGSLNPASLIDTSKLSPSDQANLAKFNNTVNTITSGQAVNSITGAVAGAATSAISKATANIKANASANVSSTSGTVSAKSNKGIDEAKTQKFEDGASRRILQEPTAPIGVPLVKVKDAIPILLQSEVRALMAQLSYISTSDNTGFSESPRLGRYAVHKKTLANYGYINSTSGAYLGKNGIKSENEFLYDNTPQDRLMEQILQDYYKGLIKCGGIRDGDKKEVVAGMLAVAYQFQDATPSLTDIASTAGPAISSITGLLTGGGDPTSLITSAASLGSGLQSTLNMGSTASIESVTQQVLAAGISAAAANVANKTPSGPAAKSGTTVEKTISPEAQKIADQSKAAAQSVVNSLAPGLTDIQAQGKKMTASVEVGKLKSAASDFAISIPVNKANDWRKSGTAKDSQKRPGSLFFNAGKYAIQILAADISASDTKKAGDAATPSTPPPTVAI